MLALILSLVALGAIAAAIALCSNGRSGTDCTVTQTATCSTCNGNSSKCEQECMMEAATQPLEYFDDEELDTFRGRPSGSYDDNETQLFADVLYTMRQDEVAAWCRSLNLRGINLPDSLKDEVVMLIQG